MSLCTQISEDIPFDCSNKPVAGIEQRIVLINRKDLPLNNITFDATHPNALITNLGLLAGKKGFEIQGVKYIMNYTNSLVADEASGDGITHAITGIRILDPSEEIRNEINKFISGAEVYVVLERKWKGVNMDHAFLFFGLDHGLMLSEMTDNSADGAMVISLATPSGAKETYVPHIYRDSNYLTSKLEFINKFESVAPVGGIFDETFDETFE